MPHRGKTSQSTCEILGNIRSRKRKLVCNRGTEKKVFKIQVSKRIGDQEAMTQAADLLKLRSSRWCMRVSKRERSGGGAVSLVTARNSDNHTHGSKPCKPTACLPGRCVSKSYPHSFTRSVFFHSTEIY